MELSQPLGGTERNKGRKATHDFLSLCSSSTAQQDPTPSPSSLGNNNYLKTHDFLQPLERTEKDHTANEAIKNPTTKVVEHVLHGGDGGIVTSYGISYPNQIRPLKQDHGTLFAAAQQTSGSINTVRPDESSRTFSIWDESAVIRKGKTGKENATSNRGVLSGLNWSSSSTNNRQHNAAVLGSFAASQPRKNCNSFVDMIASAHNDREDDDEDGDDDVDDDEFVIKKEPTSHSKGSLGVKFEAKGMDQKPNTPRSKHSATEQRRRSKINDRFQKLREIIPNSDRKRDKASFLWEVIEHVQFLQEKVNRYEGSYDVWNNESSKMTMQQPWINGHNDDEGFMDRTRGLGNITNNPASTYVTTMSEDKKSIQTNGKNLAISDVNSSLTTSKDKDRQPQIPDRDKTTRTLLSPLHQQELTVESGTINISSVYSQGLLNALTKALQSSGVDLSQARISVQIDLAKRLVGVSNSETCNAKECDVAAKLADEGFGQALKRLKTSLSN